MIPKPDHLVPDPIQFFGPHNILLSSITTMLPAIDFNNQPALGTEKICVVTANGNLTPKLQPA
jgi:hypothetical protein